nr:immunoglobulin light chain junction region [Macaca mulatta]
CQHYESLPYTF